MKKCRHSRWDGDSWIEIDLSWGPYHPDGETYEIAHLMDILKQISER